MKETIHVALIQAKPYPDLDDPRNVGHAIKLLEKCVGKALDVVCMPEYFPWLGEDVVADMARKLRCYIVAGLEENVDSRRFNTATLFDRRGHVVGRQRKVNLGSTERSHFRVESGDGAYRVFEADFGRVGLPVGIDFWGQPEAAQTLTDKGADLVINQSIFPILRGHWKQGILVRAFDNFIPVVGINAAGFNRRIGRRVHRYHGGHSIIVQPPTLVSEDDFRLWLPSLDDLEGWVALELDEREQTSFAEVNLASTQRFRAKFWSRLGFRRKRKG